MANTAVEYSIWHAPQNPNEINIPHEDRWLFSEPYHTFPIGTSTGTVKATLAEFQKATPHPIGSRGIPSVFRLRKRLIHYSEYLHVPNNDPDFVKTPPSISLNM